MSLPPYLSLSYFGISLIYTVLNLAMTQSHAVLMTALLESFDQTSISDSKS